MSDIDQRFTAAQERIKSANGLGNDQLLALYALYKQATSGDASGGRPGMLDIKGRAKYDAWAGKKGMTREQAKDAYVALVAKLAP